VLGAVYLDGGVEAAKALVSRLFSQRLEIAAGQLDRLDHKTVLQELTARLYDTAPVYILTESGPDHSKTFRATVLVDGIALGAGEGKSKKLAEQQAASDAFDVLSAED
jgi:ribonuclease-3